MSTSKQQPKSSKRITVVAEETPAQFRDTSIELNSKLPKKDRQDAGIFFTPQKARQLFLETYKEYGVIPKRILEPSCGSGEFVLDMIQEFPEANITAVEFNQTIFETISAKPEFKRDTVELVHADFTKFTSEDKYDLIVGNPPYFVTTEKNPECMTGRPNIYVSFLYKCLTQHLADDGYLGFVLPTSLYNCSYYEPMRLYIYNNCAIRYVTSLNVDYYQTSQDTMLIIIQKQQDPKHKYFWVRNETHYIMPSYTIVKALTKKSTTLLEMGMTVKTGDVVWNQEKELLVDKDTPGAVPLIYSTNLVNNELVLDNIIDRDKGKGKAKATNDGEEETVKMGKKQYIRGFRKKPLSGPALFINRGYGNTYAFDYVYVDLPAYYGENHINMILPYKDQDPETSKQELEAIMKSFRDDRTKRFIEAFVGNGALSKTELERVLPIYL